MNKKLIICASICFIVTILAILYLGSPRKLYGDPTGEVTFDMPNEIDFYKGERIWFCHVKQCARAYTQTELGKEYNKDDIYYCLDCLEKFETLTKGTSQYDKFFSEVKSKDDFILKDRSVGEQALLPKGTPIRRRNYKTYNGTQLNTTAVFSGPGRGSIHRPQLCLRAAGGHISNEFSHKIKISDKKDLDIHVINLSNVYTLANGQNEVVHSIYAYWFFNPFKETESHTTRFLYTLFDGAFLNYRPRWAYVSVAFEIDPNDPDRWKTILQDFVPRLYPPLEKYREQERSKRWIETTLDTSNQN